MNEIRTYKTVMVALLLGMTSMSLAATDTWTQKADMPTARLGLTTAVVNGKIYAIGGYARASSPGMRTVEEYDPATDTWTTKANMPTGRRWLSSSAVNGKIYAIGGYVNFGTPGLSTVEEYDPATDTWTSKAPMPTARLGLATSVVNGIIYAIGGSRLFPQQLRTVEAYDPITDTWTTKTNMPTARVYFSASAANGKIYAIGSGSGGPSVPVLATVEEYDPATDTWTAKAPMPIARGALSTCTVDGKIYAIGGSYSGALIAAAVEAYDPVTDTWIPKADLPEGRVGPGTSVVNGKLYAIGGTGTSSGGHPGTTTVYEYDATPPLVVDFNGDGTMDIKDLLRLIESWGQNEPLCDIAPQPFGDGIIDAMDLELLMSYWEQPVDDPTLIAHWALDETEGIIAYDSAGVNDAFLVGGTEWQPNNGQVNGALEFDGISGCAVTDPVLNLANGPFSVFTWINGGARGQVVVSQQSAANWLTIDAEGNLMTELKGNGRSASPLYSETVITDGQWHRIGFVWDGSNRTIYVDGVAVAKDTQNGLEGSEMGLYLGTGKGMESGTFFSGLIDDVRIYNRAVRP